MNILGISAFYHDSAACLIQDGKIVAAASAVGISPSAITEAIQDLEETVGTRLVTRPRAGITVTYDGYVFLQHCKNVLSALSAATFAVGAHRRRVEGELTIGVTITVAGSMP